MLKVALITALSLSAFLFTAPARAQTATFGDGKVTIDSKKLDTELSDLMKTQAGLFKHEYCIVCNNGTKMNCDAPVGGEAGRAICGGRGLAQCGGGHVDYNHCP
jgi:hypothetical protein